MTTVTLHSPKAQLLGYFGKSVAVDEIVAVGAPYETVNGLASAGRAYTFDSHTGAFIAMLTSPDAQVNGTFGASVATKGAIVVVGAPTQTANGFAYAGNAYVFNGKTGSHIATLTSANAQMNGFFGWCPSLGPGNIVAVGAPQETVSGMISAGRAYTFNSQTGAPIQTFATLKPVPFGGFGSCVVAAGALVFVGAPNEIVNQLAAGRVYAFNGTTGALEKVFVSPTPQSPGGFGGSVAVGNGLIIVGACEEIASGQIGAGNAYVYDSGGILIDALKSPTPMLFGNFGYPVAIGTWKMPGVLPIVAVGECPPLIMGTLPGHVYLLDTAASGSLLLKFSNPSAPTGDLFGYSIGAGQDIAVVGGPNEIVGGMFGAGRAYIYYPD